MHYILDTNILIHANRSSHPIDIHPTFWNKMSSILTREDVLSIDKVKSEIYYHEDNLTNWCKNNVDKVFWKSSMESILEYAEIQNWSQNKNYNERALAEFADSKNADPFIVAYALNQIRNNNKVSIITLEVSRPESKKSIKIPDVCIDFNIPYMNNNDFFREISVRF